MTPTELQLLFTYNDWANKRALQAASALTPDQFIEPLGNSFSSVRDTLAHLYGAETIWLQRFQGESPSAFPDLTQITDMAALRAKWDPIAANLLKFVSNLTQQEIDRVVEYKTM